MPSHPLLSAYIASLPEGLESHPTFFQKGSVARSVVQAWPECQALQGLPPQLHALLAEPPLPSAWVPEAHGMALWLLAADVRCGGDASEFAKFSLGVNSTLLEQPMYRAAFRMLGAQMTVRAISAAWSMFHRGIEQSVTVDASSCAVELRHPPHLIAPALIPSYGTAFVAGLAVVGMKSRVEVGVCTPELTRYRATWDR